VKSKIIKFFKVILPIFIGIYLTWYFLTNAITAEKRSFFIASSLSEKQALELFNTAISSGDQLDLKNDFLNTHFKFQKPLIYDEIQDEYSTLVAEKVFNSPSKTLLKPIIENDNNKLVYIANIEPEVTKQDFINSFKNVNYLWIFLALTVAFLSHLSRSYRWKFLLEPLGLNPKLSLMYHSVMIGYIINLTIPRSGEVARAGYFSKYQKSSSEKVFGTIVVERVIDLLMLGLVFIITLFLQSDQDTFNQLRQANSEGNSPDWLVPLITSLVVLVILLIAFVPKIRSKAVSFIKGVIEGGMTILKLKQKLAFILHTIFIWIAYIVMLWLTALSVPEMESISTNAIFACFIAGTIAIGATPGGIGLYPIMVASVLINLYGYPSEVANSFGILMWTTQTAFMIILGLLSLFAIKKES
tara:strand:- start:9274 stop:10515 length:1242 start_codon:yes stop_codon:yes gene_type:complete